MKCKSILLTFGVFVSAQIQIQAQTVINFDTVTIPAGYKSYADALPLPTTDSNYFFETDGIRFEGIKASWGGFSGFDCTNDTDSVNGTYLNDRSAIAGAGKDGSAQYLVGYLQTIYPEDPTNTYPIGINLSEDTVDYIVEGAYFTNTTWAYKYLTTSGMNTFMSLFIYGYNNGSLTDSIQLDLASITATDTMILRDWTYQDLTRLGAVDSISFRLESNDPFAPYYFVMDDLTIRPKTIGTSEVPVIKSLSLYPNPARKEIFFDLQNENTVSYQIYNLQGQCIQSGKTKNHITLEQLQSGRYYLHIIEDKSGTKYAATFIKY